MKFVKVKVNKENDIVNVVTVKVNREVNVMK